MALAPGEVAGFAASLGVAEAGLLAALGFAGEPGRVALLRPDLAVLGLGAELNRAPYLFGALPASLPSGSAWRLSGRHAAGQAAYDAVLGFCLGAYNPALLKTAPPQGPARLVVPEGFAAATKLAEIIWLVRDLINLPANILGPDSFAQTAARILQGSNFAVEIVSGAALDARYPMLAFAGQASSRVPHVVIARFTGSGVQAGTKTVSLCGKGVVFDSGGLDIKPPSAMLAMKKDMAGAAIMLGVALAVAALDLPLTLELRLGLIENAIAGNAMRPSDVVRTRKGVTVEIANTDAEGRLVLCDLLAEAAELGPDLLIDAATLTGAARVALGPDITPFFTNSDEVAECLTAAAARVMAPVWRLPLHQAYAGELKSAIADIGNVWEKPYAGAIVAALFLQRFVPIETKWLHMDIFAQTVVASPGRPVGGYEEVLRPILAMIADWVPPET
jgi:leucyl aminopeptidase